MQVEPQQLKAFLLDANLVTNADIEQAEQQAQKSGERLSDVLITSGKIKEGDLRLAQTYHLSPKGPTAIFIWESMMQVIHL